MYRCLILFIISFLALFGCGGSGDSTIDTPTAEAQITNVGLAYYGIQSNNWDCDAMFKGIKDINLIHIALLYKTFGMNNKCLDRLIADPRLKSLEIHVTNGAGLRKIIRRWYEVLSGESTSSLSKKLENNDPAILKIFKDEYDEINASILSKLRSDTACFISPILEHNLSAKAQQNLFSFTRKHIPAGCLIVNSPMDLSTSLNGADIFESHGYEAASATCKNCISNGDGEDINLPQRAGLVDSNIGDPRLRSWIISRRGLVLNFLWIREFNGWDKANGSGNTEPDPRSRNSFPDLALFQAVSEYITWAETRYEIPAINRKDKKSFTMCDIKKPVAVKKGFLIKRNNTFGTTIDFPKTFVEQFQSVTIEYRGKVIANFIFKSINANKQEWISVELPYDLPYHVVIHAQTLNSSVDNCFYIKNPKTINRGK